MTLEPPGRGRTVIHSAPQRATLSGIPRVLHTDENWRRRKGGSNKVFFCMARRKTMITMGSPYFVWINANKLIPSWYLLGAVCVPPPYGERTASDPSAEPDRNPRGAGWRRGRRGWPRRRPRRCAAAARGWSEKDAKLAQKLGQLQPFIAVFPQESMGQLPSFGPT
jgi:hypothetical protein